MYTVEYGSPSLVVTLHGSTCLSHFYPENASVLSSLVDSRRIVLFRSWPPPCDDEHDDDGGVISFGRKPSFPHRVRRLVETSLEGRMHTSR